MAVCSNLVIRGICLYFERFGGAEAPQFYKLGDQSLEKGRAPRPHSETAQGRVSKGGQGASAMEGTSGHADTHAARQALKGEAWHPAPWTLAPRESSSIKAVILRQMDSNSGTTVVQSNF